MSEQDTEKITLEDGDVVDAETKAIIDELEEDNEDVSVDNTDTSDKSKEETESKDTEESKDDAEAKGDDKSEEVKEEANEGKSEEKSKEEDTVESKAHRPVKAVPVAKYQNEKHKWREKESKLLEEIESLKTNTTKSEETKSTDLDELAEEYNLDPEFVKKLTDTISSKSKLSDDDKRKLEFLSEKYEREKADTEFTDVVTKFATDYPDEPIKEHLDKIKELAYTEGHTDQSVFELWFRYIKPNLPQVKHTAEKSRKTSETNKDIDFNDPNLDIDSLSDEDFDKYTEVQASKEKRLKIK